MAVAVAAAAPAARIAVSCHAVVVHVEGRQGERRNSVIND